MDILLIVLQAISLLGVFYIAFIKKYMFSYSSEKGKNLATKEDIEIITSKVESTKNVYVAEIERLKVELALHSRKNDVLFDEKIRVFKMLQKVLVDFKKYCEAAIGEYGDRGEFHPTFESVDNTGSALIHTHALHEIQLREFIFLSDASNLVLNKLYINCGMLPSIEINIGANMDSEDFIKGAIKFYEETMVNIDECLRSLYDELKFPSETY